MDAIAIFGGGVAYVVALGLSIWVVLKRVGNPDKAQEIHRSAVAKPHHANLRGLERSAKLARLGFWIIQGAAVLVVMACAVIAVVSLVSFLS